MNQWFGFDEELEDFKNHYYIQGIIDGTRVFLSDRATVISLAGFLSIILLGVFGPMITPYGYAEAQYAKNGQILRAAEPSAQYLLGTTEQGHDVLSRILHGARPTLVTGFLGGGIIVSIGLAIGVTAGYIGGAVESVLMRITDFAYGVPLIPTAIVLVSYFGVGFWRSIIIIGILLWRGNARVFRSQVLQIKQRSYVQSAEAMGGNRRHIVFNHILPNMGGMIVLFFALGTGVTILISASLSFLGFMSPYTPSWGIMLRNAYQSGLMTDIWWWTIPPGIMIALTVLTTFMIGRGYERVQQSRGQGYDF